MRQTEIYQKNHQNHWVPWNTNHLLTDLSAVSLSLSLNITVGLLSCILLCYSSAMFHCCLSDGQPLTNPVGSRSTYQPPSSPLLPLSLSPRHAPPPPLRLVPPGLLREPQWRIFNNWLADWLARSGLLSRPETERAHISHTYYLVLLPPPPHHTT